MVLSIGVQENQSTCQKWRAKYGETCPVLSDIHATAFSPFSMGYVPHNAVLDENMVVQFTNYGFNENAIRNLLTDLSDPLVKIDFTPLPNTENTTTDYEVSCGIRTSGNILPGSEMIYWNTDGSTTFNTAPLTTAMDTDYTGTIPAQTVGTTVYYYLHAEADNGHVGNDPIPAPDVLHSFRVIHDTDPPVITHSPVTQWPAEQWGPHIVAEITDDLPIDTAWIEYEINGGSTSTAQMTYDDYSGEWSGDIGGSVVVGDIVTYRIKATDTASTPHTAVLPETGSYTLDVIDILDAIIIDLDGNPNSAQAIQTELTSLGLSSTIMQDVPNTLSFYHSLWICAGVAPNNTVLTYDQALRCYEYLMAGGNAYMEGGNVWCNDARSDFTLQFAIGNKGNGSGDTGPIQGQMNTMTAGMLFDYNGDNNNMDRLKVKADAVGIFQNVSPEYVNGVIRDTGTFRTIGVSFQFAGLVDDTSPSTKHELMQQYANFFGLVGSSTPTPTPTNPPQTPTPTATPTSGCNELGVTLYMPAHEFETNDICSCKVTVCNPGPDTYTDVPLFVILDVYGTYFFWPGFTNELDYRKIAVGLNSADVEILPEFEWPAGSGSADNILWYAAMTNPEMTDLFGDMDTWTFSWHE